MRNTLGLVIAMAPEAVALVGRRGWRPIETQRWHRSPLDDRSDLVTIRSGVGWENAYAAANRLIRQGAGALISLGLSGGLSAGLRPGDLIVAQRFLMSDGRALEGSWESPAAAAEQMHALLAAAGLSVQSGCILSTRDAVLSADRKAVLLKRFGALAVDMESAAVARAAAEAGLTSLACRVVCDPAHRSVPSALFAALSREGRLRPSEIMAALLGRPALLLDMLILAVQAGRACQSLQAAWRILVRSGFAAGLAAGRYGMQADSEARRSAACLDQ
jgi:adenosylhomocysteine nucleosidase